jgi:hypothetical protein
LQLTLHGGYHANRLGSGMKTALSNRSINK